MDAASKLDEVHVDLLLLLGLARLANVARHIDLRAGQELVLLVVTYRICIARINDVLSPHKVG